MSKPRAKLLLASIPFSALLLMSFLPTTLSHQPLNSHPIAAVATDHCDGTLYPDICASTLAAIPDARSKPLPEVIIAAVNQTLTSVRSAIHNCSDILHFRSRLTPLQQHGLDDCLELLDRTIDELHVAVSDLEKSPAGRLADLETTLSASITNQYTCLDGFSHDNDKHVRRIIEKRIIHIARLVSNSLAMSYKIRRKTKGVETFKGYGTMDNGFPEWMSRKDRRLLQAPVTTTTPNLVVAKDRSGNFATITAAVAAAPSNSAKRFIIYIKAGVYLENVDVDKKKINIMFIGDGIGKTVVKASKNVVDGETTFRSATVAVVGNGFLARDITFENSAGPSKHQAVALRSGSDFSAFYRCSFVGYQDTLYVHSLRQFYRECDVYGTVDFIFGNAAVVLQNCNLYARKPNPNQKNIFTAQGRTDPGQNTGISIQNCKIAAASDLTPVQSSFKSYLGRPWKQYSRTVYLQSTIDSLIDPAGWLEWDGNFALSTLYYGEYMNRGAGSDTSKRVKWAGYRVITSSAEASKFSVASFIQGNQWLASTTIPFLSGLA